MPLTAVIGTGAWGAAAATLASHCAPVILLGRDQGKVSTLAAKRQHEGLPGFTLPGDVSASSRYFARDLTEPFVLGPGGTLIVPDGPGLGVVVNVAHVRSCLVRAEIV